MNYSYAEELTSLRLKIWRTLKAAGYTSTRPSSRAEGFTLTAVKPDSAVLIGHHLPRIVSEHMTDARRQDRAVNSIEAYRITLANAGILATTRLVDNNPVLYAYLKDNR